MPPTAVQAHATVDHAAERAQFRSGLWYGLGAYLWWGLVAGYFKLVSHVPAFAVVGHRVVWSLVLLIALITAGKQWPEVRRILRTPSIWPWLGVSTLCIATNWLLFIYAIANKRLVEASLGYFINPLVTVLLGLVFLREKMRPLQWAANAIAAGALIFLSLSRGGIPWIAMVLPVTFGFYGLIRKKAPVGPLTGMFVETLLLTPPALAVLWWAHARPAAPYNTPGTWALLLLAGVITTLPMLWYVAAAKRLPLSTLGFLQFITPTMQFLIAVLAFGEVFDRDRAIAFSLIWAAMGLFLFDLAKKARSARAPVVEAADMRQAEPV